jgi:hypothetical protein
MIGSSLLALLLQAATLTYGQTASDASGPLFLRDFRVDGLPNGQNQAGFFQRESFIAANPVDPLQMVSGFMGRYLQSESQGCQFSFSQDGGETWILGGRAPTEAENEGCADPVIAADSSGNFYYAYLDLVRSKFTFDMVVARSTDGGHTFSILSIPVVSDPADPDSEPDKDFITVDNQPGSPFRGTIYAAYSDTVGTRIRVRVSRDGGSSWSDPATLSDPVPRANNILRLGAIPVVAPDGAVYVFYSDFRVFTGPLNILFSKSSDGGISWSPPAAVALDLPSPGKFSLRKSSPGFGEKGVIGLVMFSLPTAAITGNGTVYVAWMDFPNGHCQRNGTEFPACENADVRLSLSRDGGTTWSSPVKVSDDTGLTDQFLPWIAAGPENLLSLIWQDRRLDPNNVNFDTFYTSTTDGQTFLRNIRVSHVTSLLGSFSFLGDYNGLVVAGRRVVPVWTDTRSGSEEIFTSPGVLP